VTAASFVKAAAVYASRGIAVVPLVDDEEGKPKAPASDDYPDFKPEDNAAHYWPAAKGLGIVLGRASGNLAVIDVDDSGLGEYLQRHLAGRERPPLMATTPRPGLHVFCVEDRPSKPVDLEVVHQGRRCLVQLLAAGCQVAAVPTRGYTWVDAKSEPLYGDIGACWRRLSLECGLYYRTARPWSFLRRERSRGPTTAQLREAQK
jgi:hypothetical protein